MSGAEGITKKLGEADEEDLAMLDLSWLKIDDAALGTLIAALPNIPKINQIWLNNNQIGDAGAKALCEALPASGIKKLWVNGNKFGDEGLKAFADMLTKTEIDEFW